MTFFHKIQNRIAILSAFFLIVAVAVMLMMVKWGNDRLHDDVIEQATERLTANATAELSAIARAEANSIAQEMAHSTDIALSLKQVMESFIERGLTQSVSRADISDLTGDILAKNQSVAGTYIAWLPNKVDGSDSLFAGQADHTHESGQFAPYWSRAADGSMALRPLGIPASGQSGTASSDAWYTCPLQTNKTCLTEPYTWKLQGKTVVGTSITAPVTVKGEAVGMAGVDIVLDYLTGLAQKTSDNLYDGKSRVRVVSAKGLIGADSLAPENNGQPLSDDYISNIQQLLASNTVAVVDHPDDLVVIAPIFVPALDSQWGVIINVPKQLALAGVEETRSVLDAGFASNLTSMLISGLAVALIGAILMAIVARSIARPILSAAELVNTLANQDGDLTQRIDMADRKDEIGYLATGINSFIEKTHHIVKDIAGEMNSVEGSANRASAISQDTNARVQSQRQEIELIAVAINEMSSAAGEVAQSSAATATAANEATEAVQQGASNVQQNASTIRSMGARMDQVSDVMDQLAKDSEGISHIVEVISDISEQTNLLALNAAIEAARAGDQGRGFSVVADEVRNLATKTQQSTAQIQQLIDKLQERSAQAVVEIEKSTEYTQSCISQADEAAQQLDAVVSAINQIDQMSTQIASASEQQRAVTEDVTANVERISAAVNAVAEDANSTDEESHRLLALVKSLESQLKRFKF